MLYWLDQRRNDISIRNVDGIDDSHDKQDVPAPQGPDVIGDSGTDKQCALLEVEVRRPALIKSHVSRIAMHSLNCGGYCVISGLLSMKTR